MNLRLGRRLRLAWAIILIAFSPFIALAAILVLWLLAEETA